MNENYEIQRPNAEINQYSDHKLRTHEGNKFSSVKAKWKLPLIQ